MKRQMSEIVGFRLKRYVGVTLFIALLLSVTGCISHVKELRDAQDQFNTAASLENQFKIDPMRGDPVSLNNIANSYRQSLKTVSELIDKKKGDLEKDNMLGLAYTLKALAEWRLGDYKAADNTADMAKQLGVLPRDRAVLESLRGLMKNDQAYMQMMKIKYPDASTKRYTYGEVKDLLTGALKDMDSGMTTDSAGENIRLYFLVSKLIVLKNWADLFGMVLNKQIEAPSFNLTTERLEWCSYAQPVWTLFLVETGRMLGVEATPFQQLWGSRVGMPEGCGKKNDGGDS